MQKQKLKELQMNNYQNIGNEIVRMVDQVDHLLDSTYTDTISVCFIGVLIKESKCDVDNFIIGVDDEALTYHLQMILNRYRSLIEKIIRKYNLDELKSVVLFYKGIKHRSGIIRTPDDLAKLSFYILDIKEGDTVADFGSGYGDFLINSYIMEDKAEYIGYDINIICNTVAKMKFYLLNKKDVIDQKDIVKMDRGLQFDKIFSNPPLGIRTKINDKSIEKYYPKGVKRISGIEWIFAIKAIESLKNNGRAILLMPQGNLINSTDGDIRKYFIENGFIEYVINLPGKLFFETAIPLAMIVMSRNNKKIKLVDATDDYTSDRVKNRLEDEDINNILNKLLEDSDKSIALSVAEFKGYRYQLNPNRFLNILETPNSIEFGKFIKSVNRGSLLNKKQLEDITVEYETDTRFINLKDIEDGQILNTLSYIDKTLIATDKLFKNPLKVGDLLLSRTGSPLKIAIVEDIQDKNIYYSENLYAIRLNKEKINPYYVKAFFESLEGQKILESISSGSVIPMISMKDLKDIKIPYIDLDKQNKFVKDYVARIKEINRRKIEIEEMEELLTESVDAFFKEVIQCG